MLPAKSGETNGIVETAMAFNLLKFSDSQGSVDLSDDDNNIYLNS